MSSKKVFRATVSYAELLSRCPPDQLRNLKILKDKHRLYNEKLCELPEEPPKINWDFYKCNVRPECVYMVEEFENKYNELKIPYPEDPYTQQIEEIKQKVIEEFCTFKAESEKRIEDYEDEIIVKCCDIPIEELTMEEFCERRPDIAPDFINNPTFWPHTPDEQPQPESPEIVQQKLKEEKDIEERFGYYESSSKVKKSSQEEEKLKKSKQNCTDNQESKINPDSKSGTPKEVSTKAQKTEAVEKSKQQKSEAKKTEDDKTKPTKPI